MESLKLRAATMSQLFDREIGTLNTYFTNNKKKKGVSLKKSQNILKRLS